MDITHIIEQWRAVVKQRKELDTLSKQLKEGPEQQYRNQILMYLDSLNVEGTKTRIGFVSKTRKSHIEITDMHKFLAFQMRKFQECVQEERPLEDGLFLQKIALKSGITALVEAEFGGTVIDDEQFNMIASEFGVRRVSNTDITFKGV